MSTSAQPLVQESPARKLMRHANRLCFALHYVPAAITDLYNKFEDEWCGELVCNFLITLVSSLIVLSFQLEAYAIFDANRGVPVAPIIAVAFCDYTERSAQGLKADIHFVKRSYLNHQTVTYPGMKGFLITKMEDMPEGSHNIWWMKYPSTDRPRPRPLRRDPTPEEEEEEERGRGQKRKAKQQGE